MFDNVDSPENKDQQLTFAERAVIKSMAGVGKLLLTKVSRAKTYGQLVGYLETFEAFIDKTEERYSNKEDLDQNDYDDMFNQATDMINDM